jgi:hypothetical protein
MIDDFALSTLWPYPDGDDPDFLFVKYINLLSDVLRIVWPFRKNIEVGYPQTRPFVKSRGPCRTGCQDHAYLQYH